jgi:hypothetical protein
MKSSLWGVASAAVALAVVVVGVYGDPGHVDAEQEASLPFLVAIVLATTAIVFGLLAPLALNSRANTARWALGFSLAGLLSVVAFWSGLPVVLGAAGVLVGSTARQSSAGSTLTWMVRLGALAAVADIVMIVLSVTLFV